MSKETIADIVAEMRDEGHTDASFLEWVGAKILHYADRIEAAEKREADRIHRAMVLIAGIEMEDSENPPRLWTALEDAYDALSDALGTDGDISADVEEAKAIGRYFVVKTYGNAAKMREALDALGQNLLRSHLGADAIRGRRREVSDKSRGTIAELRAENARLCAALKPVLECKVLSAMTAEIEPGVSEYCSNIIFNAQRVYNESNESEEMK